MFNQYPAYLYILRTINKKGRTIWKIGITTRSPAERLAEITADGRRHNDPTQYAQIYCVFWLTDAAKAERRLHQHYNRLQHKGLKGSGKTEWFKLYYPFFAVWCLICAKIKYLFLWLCLVALIAAACYGLISWVSK